MNRSIQSILSLCALSAGLAAAGLAHGANDAVPSGDQKFAEKAAIGGLAEVQLGNLAQQKAASDQVRQFGMRMVQDHTKANDELKQVASNKGLQLPTALDSKHQKVVDKLSKMTGADFDKAYMDDMVDDHKEDVSDFKKEANGGKDPDIKAFAAKTLPTLQDHLKMAQSTHDAVKKGAKTASR
jgi:putative membrane protein